MSVIKKLLSFIYPVTVENTTSKYNSCLEVRLENGNYVLNSTNSNYSFGSLHRIFREAFRKVSIRERKIESVLLLGLGSGSVPSILFDELKLKCNITAVEIDETVVGLAKKYFNIEKFKNLEIVCTDASEFVKHRDKKFDLIVVDLFTDDVVPQQFFSLSFLENIKELLGRNGTILFNTILKTQKNIETTAKLFSVFFKKNNLLLIEANVVYVLRSE